MDWLRCKISGKRKRFKDDKFNLDISYITPRVLAMSFPASCFESCYRNKIKKVSEFLESKHKGYYRIYNLSNRTYDYKKFNGVVKSYNWVDHHAPAIELLFEICQDMYEYLSMSQKRVVVVH